MINALKIVLISGALFIGLTANPDSVSAQESLAKPKPSTGSRTVKEALQRLSRKERATLQRVVPSDPKFKLKTDPDAWNCDGAGNCSCKYAYDCADMILNAGCKAGTLQCGLISCECNK
jgi:hypothetical protein